jgi:hypothetical protein
MKKLLLFVLACPLLVFVQQFVAGPPNTFPTAAIQVMGEGRLAGLAVGTDISSGNVSSLFNGYWQTNATWAVVTAQLNSASTLVKIATNAFGENQSLFFMPTVTQPITLGDCSFIYNSLNTNDVYPICTFKTANKPAVLIVGFELMISNWDATTFAADDMFRIGQDPFTVFQFGDGTEISGRQTMLIHTSAAGLGRPITILDNGEVYQCVIMANGPRAIGAARIWQKLLNGRKKFLGESFLTNPTNSGDALIGNVFFTMHDDHGEGTAQPSGGGKLFYSHYWMSTNVLVWDNGFWPPD